VNMKNIKNSSNAFSLVRKTSRVGKKVVSQDYRELVAELIASVCFVWNRPHYSDIFETKVPFDSILGCQNLSGFGESVVFLDSLWYPRDKSIIREEFGESVKVRHLSVEKLIDKGCYKLFKGLFVIELMGRVWAYKLEERCDRRSLTV